MYIHSRLCAHMYTGLCAYSSQSFQNVDSIHINCTGMVNWTAMYQLGCLSVTLTVGIHALQNYWYVCVAANTDKPTCIYSAYLLYGEPFGRKPYADLLMLQAHL